MSKKIIIVDAYSAGNLLAPEFRRKGAELYHVQSTAVIWPVLAPTFRPDDFVGNFAFNDNWQDLLNWAQALEPTAVLAGTETGVELADRLSESLGLKNTNGTRFSTAKRNKYLMVETCRKAGLRVAAQIAARSLDELRTWVGQNPFSRYVVKPLNSAGTDQVAICSDLGQVVDAANAILGTVNKLGLNNEQVLVQEFLEGQEYFLNTVSREGRHHFTDVWRYEKRSINGHDCVYDRNILCPSDGDIELALQAYVKKVLDALGFRYGPAHTEVIYGSDGPVLVEIGGRLDGLSVVDFNRAAIGYSPVDLTVDCYLDAEEFERKTRSPYTTIKQAQTVYLTSYQNAVVKEVPGEETLRRLSSFFQMRLRAKAGTQVEPTINYFTAPGFLSLAHENRKQLDEDYNFIRKFERTELFTFGAGAEISK